MSSALIKLAEAGRGLEPRPSHFTDPEPVANGIKNRCRYVSSRNVFFHKDNGNGKRFGRHRVSRMGRLS